MISIENFSNMIDPWKGPVSISTFLRLNLQLEGHSPDLQDQAQDLVKILSALKNQNHPQTLALEAEDVNQLEFDEDQLQLLLLLSSQMKTSLNRYLKSFTQGCIIRMKSLF